MIILAVFLALFAATIALPDNRYIRFQQLEDTVVGRSRWDYERIHFDPTPIDVAVVGDSRTEAGISAPILSAALSKAVGHPVHVANLSIPDTGRNLDYVIAKEVLTYRPELKVMLLGLSKPRVASQPAFKQLADPLDVVNSPFFVNYWYFEDLSALPFRRIKLFFYSIFPSLSGFIPNFDPHHYLGTQYDTSRSFVEPDGVFIDRDKLLDEAALNRSKALEPRWHLTLGNFLFGKHENVIEDAFVQHIAAMAARKGVKIILVHIPSWRERSPEFDVAENAKIAPLVFAPQIIAYPPQNYTDAEHLSARGIKQVSSWLEPAVFPLLGPSLMMQAHDPLRNEHSRQLPGVSQ